MPSPSPDHDSPADALSRAGQAYRRQQAAGTLPTADLLTRQALHLRSQNRYANHPVEATLHALRALSPDDGAQGHPGFDFESAEGLYRAGAQGLRLPEIPQLAQSLRELSRLSALDRAGRNHLRRWVEAQGPVFDEASFLAAWESQGRRGGAEHQVYHDQDQGRWFKRLYHGVNSSTLGDYLERMRLHAALFPETAYRLEGFTINPKSKALAPVVSQPHVEIDTELPPVARTETEALMAALGFAPVSLYHNDVRDDGHFAYVHPQTGVLAHDLHDENVVRVRGLPELAVIDPYISLARRGTWAAIKLAEIALECPPDDSP